jgi:hypothetical protein
MLCGHATYLWKTQLLVGGRLRDTSDLTTCKVLSWSELNFMDSGNVIFEEHHGVEGHALSLANRVATRNQLI